MNNFKYTSSSRPNRMIAMAVTALIVGACATAPVKPTGSDDARAKLTRLESDPNLATRAPEALREAEAAVTLAEIPQTDPEIGRSNVYLADRKVDIAVARAKTKFLEDQRMALAQQRDEARLNARTREADIANASAAHSRAEAGAANLDAANSRVAAGVANADAANSRAQAGAANLDAANSRAEAGAANVDATNSRAEAGAANLDAANSRAAAGVANADAANYRAQAGAANADALNSRAEAGAANVDAANSRAAAGVANAAAANSHAEAGAANLDAANSRAAAGVADADAANSRAQAGAANADAANSRVEAGAAKVDAENSRAEAGVANAAAANSQAEAGAANLSAANSRANAADLQRQLDDLHGRSTDHGTVITLGDVMFGTAQAHLRSAVVPNLDHLVVFLNKYPDRSIVVDGYTDNVGAADYNLGLSQRRANAVKAYLMSGGVNSARITASGLGASDPVATNDSSDGRQQNRRVEVTISNPAATSR